MYDRLKYWKFRNSSIHYRFYFHLIKPMKWLTKGIIPIEMISVGLVNLKVQFILLNDNQLPSESHISHANGGNSSVQIPGLKKIYSCAQGSCAQGRDRDACFPTPISIFSTRRIHCPKGTKITVFGELPWQIMPLRKHSKNRLSTNGIIL